MWLKSHYKCFETVNVQSEERILWIDQLKILQNIFIASRLSYYLYFMLYVR